MDLLSATLILALSAATAAPGGAGGTGESPQLDERARIYFARAIDRRRSPVARAI